MLHSQSLYTILLPNVTPAHTYLVPLRSQLKTPSMLNSHDHNLLSNTISHPTPLITNTHMLPPSQQSPLPAPFQSTPHYCQTPTTTTFHTLYIPNTPSSCTVYSKSMSNSLPTLCYLLKKNVNLNSHDRNNKKLPSNHFTHFKSIRS